MTGVSSPLGDIKDGSATVQPFTDGTLSPIQSPKDDSKEEIKTKDRWRRFRFKLTVEPLLLTQFISLGLAGGIVVIMILERTCLNYLNYSPEDCRSFPEGSSANVTLEGIVQQRAAGLLMWRSIISDLMPALGAFFIGPWSDVRGRKPFIVIANVGAALMYIMYLIVSVISEADPAFILIPSISFAVVGGILNFSSCTFSYLTDITQPEERSFRMALLDIVITFGLLLGSLLSPALLKIARFYCDGYSVIFTICSLLAVSAAVHSLFALPESRVIDKDKLKESPSILSHPVEMVKACCKSRGRGVSSVILVSAVVLALETFVFVGTIHVEFLFTRKHFGWSFNNYTIFGVSSIVYTIFGAIIGSKLLIKTCKIPQTHIVLADAFLLIFKFLIVTFAPSDKDYLMYVAMTFTLFHGLHGPCLRTNLSNFVPAEDIGKIFGFTGALAALGIVGGPAAYTMIYATYMDDFPGLVYLINAIIYMFIFALTCILAVVQRKIVSEDITTTTNKNGDVEESKS